MGALKRISWWIGTAHFTNRDLPGRRVELPTRSSHGTWYGR
jgi:hypothetical protein